MTLLRVVTSPDLVNPILDALLLVGIVGMTVADGRGCSLQQRQRVHYRGAEYEVAFVPRIELQIVLPDRDADQAINEVLEVARRETDGLNMIFVMPVEAVYAIRTGERAD